MGHLQLQSKWTFLAKKEPVPCKASSVTNGATIFLDRIGDDRKMNAKVIQLKG